MSLLFFSAFGELMNEEKRYENTAQNISVVGGDVKGCTESVQIDERHHGRSIKIATDCHTTHAKLMMSEPAKRMAT
jgi:hypothetical protein